MVTEIVFFYVNEMLHSYKNILVIISDKYQSEKCGMCLKNQRTDTTVCKEGQNYS